jgi:hypothetical protein
VLWAGRPLRADDLSSVPWGVVGGLHGGYNWQFGQFVLGIEADSEGADIRGGYRLANALSGTFFVLRFRPHNCWSFWRKGCPVNALKLLDRFGFVLQESRFEPRAGRGGISATV